MPEAIRFQGVKKLFYAFLPRRKKSMSERSEFGFFLKIYLRQKIVLAMKPGDRQLPPTD